MKVMADYDTFFADGFEPRGAPKVPEEVMYRRFSATCALLLLLLSPAAFAFRSTNIESYTDLDYRDYRPKKVVVLVINASNEMRRDIEKRLGETLGALGVQAVPQRELFPPTRTWSQEDQTAICESRDGKAFVNGVISGLTEDGHLPKQ